MRILLTLALSSAAAHADWQYTEHRDSFSGEALHIASTESVNLVDDVLGEPSRALLQLRCDKDNGNPYWRLAWPNMLDTRYATVSWETQMQIRFDDGRIYGPGTLIGGWIPEDAAGTTQALTTYAVRGVLKRALDAKLIRVRDTTFDGRTLDAEFSTDGLAAALEELSAHCKRI